MHRRASVDPPGCNRRQSSNSVPNHSDDVQQQYLMHCSAIRYEMTYRVAMLPTFFLAVCLGFARLSQAQSLAECQALTDHYLEKHHKEASPYTGSNLLYFLHVPRTAGRTFHSCLLKLGVPPALRCPKAYDHLRITNMSRPNCYLLSSHDDFSVVSMLPPDVAVLTQLRDPVDRFLSAYEFAVEVASRALKRPKTYRRRVGRIATDDVWPWSYLVPFFTEDLKAKVPVAQAKELPPGGVWAEMENKAGAYFFNKVTNQTKESLTEAEAALGIVPMLDPYDNELVISLKDFAKHPIASELLHNGATFQVLGITNYSHWGDAGGFRACLLRYDHLRSQLLEVAKNRVQHFTHVGTTDRLHESAASALVSMGLSVDSPAYGGGDEEVAGRRSVGVKLEQSANRTSGLGGGGRGAGYALGNSGLDSQVAARLKILAKLIREARRKLQNAQKELVNAQKSDADPSIVKMLQGEVDTARNQLIEAQERLANLRERLPADLGGAESADLSVSDLSVGHEARRRLLQEDAGSSQQQQQQQQQEGSGTSAGSADGATGAAGSSEDTAEGLGKVDEVAEQRRRLASKVTLRTVDALGYQLDPEYRKIPRTTLGLEFLRCANRAQERSVSRRDQSLAVLQTADGRHVTFSKAARNRIPQEVLDLIRSYNTMDTALHKVGLSLLDQHIAEQKAENLYQDVPKEDVESLASEQGQQMQAMKSGGKANGDELR
ncbi:hypothetical protein VaNZ11_003852 [Volvox africanus]|uniref:Sulfotransferase domain-containing protein n=1 Tax=Volvox africanus TaxID=51714 RepID=A0ABQ5RV96_9CHLO|nr:hypothetical protein VaNZ11_003852 [Volvox africanus]